LGAEADTLDWISLGAMALGPVAWLVIILLVALPAKHWRLIDITGVGGFSAWHVVALGVALACAGGGYPFLAWLRRRAAFAMPAGVGAVIIGVIPAALLVGARTYSALRDTGDHWPQFALGVPPITAGILMTLLGGVSVLIAGLLALGRRDGRSLLALLALAQLGWGLIALGVGQPVSALGLVLLLATSVLGLGAALAALVAGRAVTADEEEPSAGPRVFGARLSAPSLFAWGVGVASLVGAPLFAGFAPQELISAAALPTTKLGIPLVGIAWAGDALLALALVRATALAFVQSPSEIKAIRDAQAALDNEWEDEEDEADEADEVDEDNAVEDEGADVAGETASAGAPTAIIPRAQRSGGLPGLPELRGDDIPGVIVALLIVALGVAPEWLFALGGQAAANELLSTGALDGFTQINAAGYSIAIGAQWLPGLAAWVAVILIVLVVLMQARATRVVRPVYLAGQSARDLAPQVGAETDTLEAELAADTDTTAAAALELAEPTAAWSDLQPAFASAWLTPASQWIIVDNDDEADDEDGEDDSEAEEVDGQDVAVAAPTKEATRVATRVATPAVSAKTSAKANGATAANGKATPITPTPKSIPTSAPTRTTATTGTPATARGGAPTGKTGAPQSAATVAPTSSPRQAPAPTKGSAGAAQGRPTPPKQKQAQTPVTALKPGATAKPAQAPRQAPAQASGKLGGSQPSSSTGAQAQPKPQPKSPPKAQPGGARKNNQHNQRGGR
ncbi:MAG TPA: proton-conducting transporter membrane subunit, partial [Ktedonobacterales bacterium]|nr:proton-conducting transporter membrane subunit [Ktedonobacterales bacterium]